MKFTLIDVDIGWDDNIFSTTKGVVYYFGIVLIIAILYSVSVVMHAENLGFSDGEQEYSDPFASFALSKDYLPSNIQRDTIVSPLCCIVDSQY